MEENKIILREERVAIIEVGKMELWRVFYNHNKIRLEVRHINKKEVITK